MAEIQNPLEEFSLDQLRERKSIKWRAYGEDVLPLWIAEMDTPLAEPIKDSLREIIERGDTGYPYAGPFVEAFRGFAQQRWGWSPAAAQVRAVRDVMTGVAEALRLVGETWDTVIVSSPVYPPFFQYPVTVGRRVVEAPLGHNGRLDFEMLEESFNLRTAGGQAAYLLCNPHNPTGVAHTRAELEQLAQLAADYDIRVVADEIHAPLVYSDATFTPYLSVDSRGYSIMAASKAWNLAGLKAGLLIAGDDATDELMELPPEVGFGASHAGVLTQTAAYADGGAWLDAALKGLQANRDLLSELLAEHAPQVAYWAPEATYLAWLDFSAYGFEDDESTAGLPAAMQGPAKHLLDQGRVALMAGHDFGMGGERHARLNFATNRDILTEAVRRIGEALR